MFEAVNKLLLILCVYKVWDDLGFFVSENESALLRTLFLVGVTYQLDSLRLDYYLYFYEEVCFKYVG